MQEYLTTKKRLLSLLLIAVSIFILLFGRLFYLQIVSGSRLRAKAYDQWTRDLPLQAMRGDIVDINGEVLATSVTSYGVYVRPRTVVDAETVSSLLSEKLNLNYNDVYAKVTVNGVSEVTVAKQVKQTVVDELRKHNLVGVYFAVESSREYVYGDFLSQVLGFVSIDNNGQGGIEQYYNDYLKGINGQLLTETDLIGGEISNSTMQCMPAIDGMQVQLTIDATVQTIVENVLDLVMYQQQSKSASAIVLDVNTGAILAMSSKPSVDLNELPRDNLTQLMATTKNVMLTDIYEPGSTFKVLTSAANLQEYKNGNSKAVSASYVFPNNSNFRIVDGGKVKCWSTHAGGKHSNQTLSDALCNSCNPIFTDIALSLGKETYYEYLEKFGYGSPTGIDFLGEQSGLVISKSGVTQGDLARIGFGQSIAVTPLQLCMATASAVNGGYLLEPYLVQSITDNFSGVTIKTNSATVVNRTVDSDVSRQLAEMLENVVTNGGGKNAYIEGYQVGGKTGTAQKYENGKIANGKYISSFIGFFPASEPKYLALVMVNEPQGQSYGSIVAAPYGKAIFQGIIDCKKIKPFE